MALPGFLVNQNMTTDIEFHPKSNTNNSFDAAVSADTKIKQGQNHLTADVQTE